jgi:hypothetical protein
MGLLTVFALGCTAIRPSMVEEEDWTAPPKFSHEFFDRVLERFVDERGFVDYAALKNAPGDLEQYYFEISKVSPDSHPDLFPTEQDKLAYWINAYNATSIKTVITYYPIATVLDVRPPFPFFFLPKKAGFFVFQRGTYGGETTSLYSLEKSVIRKRFGDPRVHFALNCSSRGCPRLPNRAFSGANTDQELDRAAREFLGEERNFRIDHERRVVFLSEIFDWYESDYLDWYKHRFPDRRATLANYVALYLPAEKANQLTGPAASYEIRFIPYDWRLNDRSGTVSSLPGNFPHRFPGRRI